MEKKLAEYRSRKEREEKINQVKEKAKNLLQTYFKPKTKVEEDKICSEVQEPLLVNNETNENPHDSDLESNGSLIEETPKTCTYLDLLYYLLWVSLWIVLYIIFIKLEFGVVFLIVSALIFMYINTRTAPKKSNEVSAYSVFNKDCKSIDGTLTAEQFEQEIRYGSGAVR